MVTAENITDLLAAVVDPEIPELSIIDLGIVRGCRVDKEHCHIILTPTYSGCPAYETIEQDIRATLEKAGFSQITIEKRYSPPWTTDWLSARARAQLKSIGIAPPPLCRDAADDAAPLTFFRRQADCPRCGSRNTEQISFFASTACKAHHRCLDCLEPFDAFKAI